MSASGNWYIAQTQGTAFTMYAQMKLAGIPLTEIQAETQAKLEALYPSNIALCEMCNPELRKKCLKYRNAW